MRLHQVGPLSSLVLLLAASSLLPPASRIALAQSPGGGTLVYGTTLPLDTTLNPFQSLLGTSDPTYPLIFSPIVNWTSDGKPFSTILTAVPTLQDHLAYREGDNFLATVQLKPGVKWSDGQPITSDDFAFSYHVNRDIFSSSPFTGVDTVDPRTAIFQLPFLTSGDYLQNLYDFVLLPKHAFPSEADAVKTLSTDDTASYTSDKFVTSGPFIVASYDHSSGITFKPNPNYGGSPPALNEIDFRMIVDPSSVPSLLGHGLDVASGLSTADLPALRAQSGITTSLVPGGTLDHVVFNTTIKPFDDENRRRAFAEAINRDAICQQALKVTAADCSHLLTSAPGFPPLLAGPALNPVAFNPDDARKRLAAEGYGGQPVTLTTVAGSTTFTAMANAIADSWRNVLGINVSIQPVSLSQLFSRQGILQNGTFGVIILPELAYHDPVSALDQFDSNQMPSPTNLLAPNFGRVHDSKLDSAIQGARTALDPAQRDALYRAAQQQALDKAYDVPLFFTPRVSAHDSRIQDFVPTASGDTWNADEWSDSTSGVAAKPLPDTTGAESPALWKPEFLIDGLKATGYETGPGQVTNQSVTIGFKNNALYTVSQIWLDPAATAGHPADMDAKDVDVQISTTGTDDASFKTVGSATLQASDTLQSVNISQQKARYVRVVLKTNGGNPTFIDLSEFMAVGSPTAAGPLRRTLTILPSIAVKKPARLATVQYIRHGLSVTHVHTKAQKAKVKAALYGRDLLHTAKRQGASVRFRDKTTLHMSQLTDAVLSDPQTTTVRRGEVDEILTPGSNHVVKTSAVTATAIGTNFDVKVAGATTTVTVIEGVVQVQNPQGSVVVKAGQQSATTVGSEPSPPTTANTGAVTSWMSGYPKTTLPVNLALDTNGGHIVGTSS